MTTTQAKTEMEANTAACEAKIAEARKTLDAPAAMEAICEMRKKNEALLKFVVPAQYLHLLGA